MRHLILLAALAMGPMPSDAVADETADARTYWAYEGGWFAKANDGAWYEMNEQTFRKLGKASYFKEIRRTKDYVELRDDGRKVIVRLSAESSEVHLFDKPGVRWEALYKGRWKVPAPLE